MSNVAENLAKVQGTVSRWSRLSLGVVWGRSRREGGETRLFYVCHHAPFILTTSLRIKDFCLYSAKGYPRVRARELCLASKRPWVVWSPTHKTRQNKNKKSVCYVWWCTLITLAFGRPRQEDNKLEASLSSTESSGQTQLQGKSLSQISPYLLRKMKGDAQSCSKILAKCHTTHYLVTPSLQI